MPVHNDLSETPFLIPSVSIIMPFDPKMTSERLLFDSLGANILKAEQFLIEGFPLEIAMLVINKLKSVIKYLNYSTYKKSIAIYVSPVFEKIIYLDMEVEERVVVEDSFEIRDIIHSKKEIKDYLILVFGEEETKIYLDNIVAVQQIFSNRSEIKKSNCGLSFTEKYLQHVDIILDVILQSFRVPLFVLGDKYVMHRFKNITKHACSIIEYAEHDCKNISPGKLRNTVSPLIHNCHIVKQKMLRQQLKHASGSHKVISGINEVFKEVMRHQGHLLLVEKNYRYPDSNDSSSELIAKAVRPYSQFSYINDAVDDVIEKVLEEYGDVEFVDKGLLKNYDHIALIL